MRVYLQCKMLRNAKLIVEAATHSSLVSYGIKQRAIGEAAKTLESSNFKNTVGSLKRLAGRVASDPEIAEIESKFLTASLCDAQGTVGVQVRIVFVFLFEMRTDIWHLHRSSMWANNRSSPRRS